MRALILGEAPHPPITGPALSGRVGDRLARLCGLRDYEELRGVFDVANLLDAPVGVRSGKGDAFPAQLAQRRAREFPLQGVVVLLGRRVARAYGLADAPWGEWQSIHPNRAVACVVPHPSGVNHVMNDPAMRRLVGRVLRQARVLAMREEQRV